MEGMIQDPQQTAGAIWVLVLEDSPADAELCLGALRKEGLEVSADIARTPEEFRDLVRSKPYDVVLSDYNLLTWNALDAFKLLHEEGMDIPFVLVTGAIGDEAAVECVKIGISDYVLKDNLARLPFAVRRAIVEKSERQERGRLQEQLQQFQKMEAIGRLAGGLAHDFNNLLTVMNGYSQMILDRLSSADPLRPPLIQIKEAGDRAATLTRQLLAFSRKQVLALQVLDLNCIVANMNKMLPRLIGEDIELVAVHFPGLGCVKADPGQIDQVIMNLAINARDAMPQGGKLTIETANVELDEGYSRNRPFVVPGAYVMLAVSDTGTGMSPRLQSRIFEPFFTTKEQGKGTGFGLATVYGIVKHCGGYIWVYSEPGKGATFKVYLPRVEEAAQRMKKKAGAVHAAGGSETILLVEDNESVRTFVRSVLEPKGYQLLVAGGSEDALKVVENHDGPIHLLLTDVVMPRMGGPELAARLAPLHPEARVLYMSGYTDSTIVHHGVLGAGTHFLQKPFVPETLIRKTREVLDE